MGANRPSWAADAAALLSDAEIIDSCVAWELSTFKDCYTIHEARAIGAAIDAEMQRRQLAGQVYDEVERCRAIVYRPVAPLTDDIPF